jgi:hypothetical protein
MEKCFKLFPMTDEKKNGVSVDAAEITEKALDGISEIVPILEKHPKGALYLLVLLGMVSATAIAILTLTKSPAPEKKAEPTDSANIKKIESGENGEHTFQIQN